MIFQTSGNKRRSQKSEIVKNSPSGRSMGAARKGVFRRAAEDGWIGLRGKLLTRRTLRMRANIERSAGDFRTVLKASVPVPAIQRASTSSSTPVTLFLSLSLSSISYGDEKDERDPPFILSRQTGRCVNPLTHETRAWPSVKCRLKPGRP